MSKKSILLVLTVLLVVVLGLSWLLDLKNKGVVIPSEKGTKEIESTGGFVASKTYLFVGEGCGHCAEIEKFIKENGITEKVAMEIQEVFVRVKNQKNYLAAFEACGKVTDSIAVPVFYAGGACFQGSDEIKEKLRELAGMQE